MADFLYTIVVEPSVQVALGGADARPTSTALAAAAAPSAGSGTSAPAAVTAYRQRIWDQGANRWVYYEGTSVTASPAAADTTPNHSGNLKVQSHEVVSKRVV